jgi:hypothetical protein
MLGAFEEVLFNLHRSDIPVPGKKNRILNPVTKVPNNY